MYRIFVLISRFFAELGSRRKRALSLFSTRPELAITCPSCGKEQNREQDSCCACGTLFVFLDESNRFLI